MFSWGVFMSHQAIVVAKLVLQHGIKNHYALMRCKKSIKYLPIKTKQVFRGSTVV
jgi:hypothetical protein